jgi:hypothetical protein
MATTLLIGVVVFSFGAVLIVSWGVQREERDFSLTRRLRAG